MKVLWVSSTAHQVRRQHAETSPWGSTDRVATAHGILKFDIRLSNFQPSPNCWKMLEDAIVLRLLFDLIVQESAAPPSRVPSSWIDKPLQNLARRDVNSTLTSELNLGWIYGLVCWAVQVWKKHIAYWCLLYIGMHWDVLGSIGKYSIVWTCSPMFAPCLQMHSDRDGQTWKAHESMMQHWHDQNRPGPARTSHYSKVMRQMMSPEGHGPRRSEMWPGGSWWQRLFESGGPQNETCPTGADRFQEEKCKCL